jgi:NarL family two-component system response regulator LiaR
MMPVRIVLVEDHPLVRAGLRTALQSAGIEVVAEAADGVTAFGVIAEARPDVAVLDIGLPGRSGIELTRELKREPDPPRVVVLTMYDRDEHVLAALAAGADGYCVKASDPSTVIDAVRTVAASGAYFDPRIAHVVLRAFSDSPSPPAPSPLTARETEIVKLIAEGSSNAEIAERIHLALGTVKAHVADVLAKLSAADRAHAAVTAYRRGYIR